MSGSLKTKLTEINHSKDTKSLVFEYNDSQTVELKKGLEAPLTEFVRPQHLACSGIPLLLGRAESRAGNHKSLTNCASPR